MTYGCGHKSTPIEVFCRLTKNQKKVMEKWKNTKTYNNFR